MDICRGAYSRYDCCMFRPASDLCTEALKLLDSVNGAKNVSVLDLKARAHLSMFILRAPDHIDKV